MATILSPLPQVEHRVVLRDVSWEAYERLLAEQGDRGNPRLTYDREVLEIISPLAEHEDLKHTIALVIDALAEGLDFDTRGYGSTTFRRKDLACGFEPDACFYIRNVARVKGETRLDQSLDPPPTSLWRSTLRAHRSTSSRCSRRWEFPRSGVITDAS